MRRGRSVVKMHHVEQRQVIDTSFNFKTDTPRGHDPDKWSPTLHRYHGVLWGRPLPSGRPFELEDARPRRYLRHRSLSGGPDFWLSSDAVMPTFTKWTRPAVKQVVSQAAKADREEFYNITYTIGAMMLFPGNPVDGMWTINQARGCTGTIADRFDLTVECIRRHYFGLDSPLGGVLRRYADFFELFETFDGYVEHFLLHDMLTDDGAVRFLLPFDDFARSPLPRDIGEYEEFRRLSVQFVRARNARIDRLAAARAT